jgi:hypothetical protein
VISFTSVRSGLRWLVERLLPISLVLSLLLVVWIFVGNIPGKSVEVRAGVKGAYFQTASEEIGKFLKKDGINIKILNRADSGNIINDVLDPTSKIQAGFVAQDLNGVDMSNIESYGVVNVRAMMMFAKGMSEGSDIATFSGGTIYMLPEGSASSQVCVSILDRYFKGSTKPVYSFAETQPEAVDQYVRSSNAGLCLLDDYQSESIRKAALTPDSVLLSVPDALALAQSSGWLTTKRVPSGAWSSQPRRPSIDITSLGGPIQFLAKSNLHVGIQTALSKAIFSAFSEYDPIDEREYPYFPGGDTSYSDRAESVYDGGLPWMYRLLSFRSAATTDAVLSTYGVWFAVLYFLTNLYMFAGFITPADAFQRRRMRSNERFIKHMTEKIAEGDDISKKDKKQLERLRSTLGRSIVNETQNLESINAILSDRNKHSSSV